MKKILSLTFALFICMGLGAQILNETLGTGAGSVITSGDYNVEIGDSAGANLSTGSYNTHIGFHSGFTQTSAQDNVFIGYYAGSSNTSGNDNTFVGKNAGASNTSATDNTFIGTTTGYNNTTGYDNTFVGEESGMTNTTGHDNTFIGEDAGYYNETGYDNTFIGSTAGRSNTTGYRNCFVGNEAGYDNSTGFWNTCVGDSAGTDIGVGYSNTMLGHAAGAATEHADYNTFVGAYAGWDNNRTNNTNDANRNTYVGYYAGFSNREGEDNVGMGANADYGNTVRSRNTFIGSSAYVNNNDVTLLGYNTYATGQYGIAIGSESDVRSTGGISMGYNTYVQSGANYSIGLGHTVSVSDDHTVAIGYLANTSRLYSLALGSNSANSGDSSIAMGAFSLSSAISSVAIGDSVETSGYRSIAIGSHAKTSGSSSIAIGPGATTAQDQAMVLGGATSSTRMNVGIGTATPNTYASMTLADTDRGFLINRMTTALRTTLGSALTTSEQGLMVYDTDANILYTWDGTQWNSNTDTDAQSLSLTGTNLTISNGNTVDLSSIDTDTQLTEAEVDAYVANNGYLTSFTEVDGDPTNEIQDISLTGTDLTISSGSTIDLSSIDTDTQLTEAEVDAYVANNGYLTSFTEVDGDPTNELQDISLTGTDLTISSGSTIDLSSIDTDTQLTEAEVDAYVANNGYLTSFTEVDGDPTNELQDISLTGTDLTISSGSTIDLSSIDTDTQLSEAEVDAYVANNGYLTSFTEVDGDPTNEIQDISLTGTDLTISSGSTIDLSSIDTDTQLSEAEVDAYVANNGYLTSFTEVDGDPTNEIQDLDLTANTLTITSGSTSIDLTAYLDNTDQQDLTAATLTGNILQIDIQNGASVSVDLSPLLSSIEATLQDHEDRITYLEGCACQGGLGQNGEVEKAILYQNIPNPFNNTSSIKYYIPSFATSANLVFSDEIGQIVSNLSLSEVGDYGTAQINAAGLAPGTYYYSLYVNQTLVDTKKMIVQ